MPDNRRCLLELCVTQLEQQIDAAKRKIGYLGPDESSPGKDIQELLNRVRENPPDTPTP